MRTQRLITAAGTALRISDTGGSGPALLLLHGYLESIEVWDDFTALIEPRLRVLAVDLPGHGISEVKGEVHTMEFLADVVHDALRRSGVERCVVCGHSMGGYAALELLRKYPSAVSGIVLFHSTAFADNEERRESRRREIAVVEAGKKDLLAAGVERSFAPENRRRMSAAIEELSDQVFLTEEEGVLALLRGMEARRDNNDTLAQSAVPELFIFGRGDEYLSAEIAAEMIRLHPRAQVLWLENSGHAGFIEEPVIAAEAIVEFVELVELVERAV